MRSPDDRAHSEYPGFLLPKNFRTKPHTADTSRKQWIVICYPKIRCLTVLCSGHEPTDFKLLGNGKLQLNSMCKACGKRNFIQSHSTLVSKRTRKDVIPPFTLEYDCCGGIHNTFKLNDLHLHIPLRIVTNSLDDLRIASHKVRGRRKPNTWTRLEN